MSASVLADSGTQDDVGDCKSYSGSMNWVDLSSDYDVMRRVPLHLSETKDRTYNQFDWSTTEESQMQVAYNGKYNGVPYSGGMSYSRNNVSGTGVSAVAFKEAYRINMLRMGWKFRKQYLRCSVYSGRGGFQFDTGERRYVPHHWTTDNVNREVSNTFACQAENRVRWDNDVWVSRSTSKTFAGYFSIFGVTLDSKQTRGTDHRIWYQRKNDSISAMGCGKGADPFYASWVREYQM